MADSPLKREADGPTPPPVERKNFSKTAVSRSRSPVGRRRSTVQRPRSIVVGRGARARLGNNASSSEAAFEEYEGLNGASTLEEITKEYPDLVALISKKFEAKIAEDAANFEGQRKEYDRKIGAISDCLSEKAEEYVQVWRLSHLSAKFSEQSIDVVSSSFSHLSTCSCLASGGEG
tara:strand:+ start:1344 stop:1871 length:528 start_codon:yes stop_codon:yes gene_type:complete